VDTHNWKRAPGRLAYHHKGVKGYACGVRLTNTVDVAEIQVDQWYRACRSCLAVLNRVKQLDSDGGDGQNRRRKSTNKGQ